MSSSVSRGARHLHRFNSAAFLLGTPVSFPRFHPGCTSFVRASLPVAAAQPGQQCRCNHVAVVATGVGDALAALPGAGRDGKGQIAIPVPDAKLRRLAELERTKAVSAMVEAADVHADLVAELGQAVDEVLQNSPVALPELSGKLLSAIRAADAVAIAVPCPSPAAAGGDPVAWFEALQRILIESDLHALEQQVCKGGATGPDEELDVAKLRKSLSTSKDATVRRNADGLVKELLAPGFTALRVALRSGKPARAVRAGLNSNSAPSDLAAGTVDAQFEDLARGWLNALVTWKPLCLLADVPSEEASLTSADADVAAVSGNTASARLLQYAKEAGTPCVALSSTLEGEVASLNEEPEFLVDYLESLGLRQAVGGGSEEAKKQELKPWRSQAGMLAVLFPRLLNFLTYYTAGEKEARAWLCHRVDRDGNPRPFKLQLEADSSKLPSDLGKAPTSTAKSSKASAALAQDGVPVPYAARAIHSGFFEKVKAVEVWSYNDLDALGVADSGPGAKDRARSLGKVRKLPSQAFVEEGDVVEFVLPS